MFFYSRLVASRRETPMPAKAQLKPRKRPKQERSSATVDAILDAAARVLVKQGFERATTNRVAEEAGVSIGSLYQYFPNKEALVAALMQQHLEEMSSIISSTFARIVSEPVPIVVREMVRLMIRAHAVNPRLHKALMEQLPMVGGFERFKSVEGHVVELARTYLEVHKDEVRPQNLELAATVAVGTIEALTHGAVLHRPDLLETDELEREIADLVVRYLVKDATPSL
jgi:AcrR family transcriptional regulator